MLREIAKIKKIISKVLKEFWQNLFLVLIFLLILDLIIGGIFFFEYYLKEKRGEFQVPPALKINQNLLNKFSSDWQDREINFERAKEKEYLDPFRSPKM
ncbi:MAG: hypothetical protein QMC93_02435 [Patescibacteria group bacterium]|nr:hypothetical protein [Patescibacteria group bacterium]